MAVTKNYKCADCGEVLSSTTDFCPKCGSNRINSVIGIVVTERIELRVKVKEQSGRVVSKFLKRQKLSNHGKEANEELRIDVDGNRKFSPS